MYVYLHCVYGIYISHIHYPIHTHMPPNLLSHYFSLFLLLFFQPLFIFTHVFSLLCFACVTTEIPADSRAIISGPADLHFKVGSAIILSCHVQQPSVRDIGPIYWYRGEHIITPFELDEDEESDSDSVINSNKNKHSHSNAGGDMATPALTGNELAADVTAPITNAKALTAAAGGPSAMAATVPHDGLSNDITPDFTARIAMESQLGDTMKSR